MSYPVKNHRALVTGGTRGIGRAIAQLLAAEGALVSVMGRGERAASPSGCEFIQVNLAEDAALQAGLSRVREIDFDILINCAGINKVSEFGPFEKTSMQDFDLIQKVNVRAPFMLMQAVLPGMLKAGWGRIVNITSILGVISKAERAAYSASKFALDGMTQSLAAEAASRGILANCVAPGFVETDMTRQALGERGMQEMARQVPLGRLAQPSEIAHLVAWLASENNTYVSGQTLVIDGGFTRV